MAETSMVVVVSWRIAGRVSFAEMAVWKRDVEVHADDP